MTRFWALVDNSGKFNKDHNYTSNFRWQLFNTLLVLLTAAFFSYSLGPFSLFAFVPVVLLLAAFFLASSQISREWREQTISWWLTVPCSRSELLASKLLGTLIRLTKIAGISIVATALIALGWILLKPDIWTMPAISAAALMASKLYILTIIVSPLAMALGMFFAVLTRSRFKFFAPFIIAFVGAAFGVVANYLLPILGKTQVDIQLTLISQIPVFNLSFTAIVIRVVLMLFIAAVILALSSYLLAEQTEV